MKKKDPHAVALGRRGGQVKSTTKMHAARANGQLGGRPKRAQVPDPAGEPASDAHAHSVGDAPKPSVRNCGECLMTAVEIVELDANGVCPRCGADYGRS